MWWLEKDKYRKIYLANRGNYSALLANADPKGLSRKSGR
jgi:hypothetical protein